MSGHSHFKTVKARKDSEDAKKGKIFSKLAKVISLAAKGNPDPFINSKLRMAIEKSKEFNMPKENIEMAIKKGSGELGGEQLEEVVFEAFGPGGVALIIEGITDNKNRTLGEIKQILNQNNGKLAGEGAVQWMFEKKGVIAINNEAKNINKEQLEMDAIEAGADDIVWHETEIDVYTKTDDLEKVKKGLLDKNYKIESSSLGLIGKDNVAVDEKTKSALQRIFEELDENDAVQNTYSNLKE